MTKKIQFLFQISVNRFSKMSLVTVTKRRISRKRRKKLFLLIRLSRPPGCICEKGSVCGFASHLYEQFGYLPRLFPLYRSWEYEPGTTNFAFKISPSVSWHLMSLRGRLRVHCVSGRRILIRTSEDCGQETVMEGKRAVRGSLGAARETDCVWMVIVCLYVAWWQVLQQMWTSTLSLPTILCLKNIHDVFSLTRESIVGFSWRLANVLPRK